MRRTPTKTLEDRAFLHYLRTGQRLSAANFAKQDAPELKFNPYHDPHNGQFTFGPGGGASQRGQSQGTRAANLGSGALHDKRSASPARPGTLNVANTAERQGGRTASAARSSPAVSGDQLRSVLPKAGKKADQYSAALNRAMDKHGINTSHQKAAFLAQIGVESADLQFTEEQLSAYSAKRLTEVFPKRFPDIASARPYAHNPEAIANRVYANRNGNGSEASGDGYRFRGRGLIQITGRANYRAVGYENNPEALNDPEVAAETAARFWTDHNLGDRTSRELSRSQFDAISRTVNGGNHGSVERWNAYQRGLKALQP